MEQIDIDHRAVLSKSKPIPARPCDAARASVIAGTALVAATAPSFPKVKPIPCISGEAVGVTRSSMFPNGFADEDELRGESSGDPFRRKRIELYEAWMLLEGTTAAVGFYCNPFAVIPVVVAARTGALLADAAASLHVAAKQAELQICLDEQESRRRNREVANQSAGRGSVPIPPTETPIRYCATVVNWTTNYYEVDGTTDSLIDRCSMECRTY
ncbi:MAG: hypothetical protein H0W68_08090 [Gemmatimonadaceae bacterium]|nr:hypothetical protein [Gemmatimonadaceae bacterium]